MSADLNHIRQEFVTNLGHISRFWGFPSGVGAVFAILYISPAALSLDDIVREVGLTKGAVSTDVRALARMGLVRRSSRIGDRRDYYEAETDFYRAIRSILGERQNTEFARAVESVGQLLGELKAGRGSRDEGERKFLIARLQALQDFFGAIDSLARAVSRMDSLGLSTVRSVLSILK